MASPARATVRAVPLAGRWGSGVAWNGTRSLSTSTKTPRKAAKETSTEEKQKTEADHEEEWARVMLELDEPDPKRLCEVHDGILASARSMTVAELGRTVRDVRGRNEQAYVKLLTDEMWTRKTSKRVTAASSSSIASAQRNLCRALMRRYALWQQLDKMIQLYWKMDENKVAPDAFTATVLVLSLARAHRIEEMSAVLDHVLGLSAASRAKSKSKSGVHNVLLPLQHEKALITVLQACRATNQLATMFDLYQRLHPPAKAAKLESLDIPRILVAAEDQTTAVEPPEEVDRLLVHDLQGLRLDPDQLDSILTAIHTLTPAELQWYAMFLLRHHGPDAMLEFQKRQLEGLKATKPDENLVATAEAFSRELCQSSSIAVTRLHHAEACRFLLQLYGRAETVTKNETMLKLLCQTVESLDMELSNAEAEALLRAVLTRRLAPEVRKLLDFVVEKNKVEPKFELGSETAWQAMNTIGTSEASNPRVLQIFHELVDAQVVRKGDRYLCARMLERFVHNGERVLAKKVLTLLEREEKALPAPDGFIPEQRDGSEEEKQIEAILLASRMGLAALYTDQSKMKRLAEGAPRELLQEIVLAFSEQTREVFFSSIRRMHDSPIEALQWLSSHGLLAQSTAEGMMEAYLRFEEFDNVHAIFYVLSEWGLVQSLAAHSIRIRALTGEERAGGRPSSSSTGLDLIEALESMERAHKTVQGDHSHETLERLLEYGHAFHAEKLYDALREQYIRVQPSVFKHFAKLGLRWEDKDMAHKYKDFYLVAVPWQHEANSRSTKAERGTADEQNALLVSMQVNNKFGEHAQAVTDFRTLALVSVSPARNALDLWRGNKLPTEAYGQLILAQGNCGDKKGVDLAYHHMKLYNVERTLRFFHQYLCAQELLGCPRNPWQILREIHLAKLKPDVGIYVELMRANIRAHAFKDVLLLYSNMRKEGIAPTAEATGIFLSSKLRRLTIMSDFVAMSMGRVVNLFAESEQRVEVYRHIVETSVMLKEFESVRQFTEQVIELRCLSQAEEREIAKIAREGRGRPSGQIVGGVYRYQQGGLDQLSN